MKNFQIYAYESDKLSSKNSAVIVKNYIVKRSN